MRADQLLVDRGLAACTGGFTEVLPAGGFNLLVADLAFISLPQFEVGDRARLFRQRRQRRRRQP